MADDSEPHKPGTMNIAEHEKTFNGFIRMVTNGAILCIIVLIFLALVNG
ncbi:aa3-type cytochrome c oxidase subunit IV [Tropicimonas sp. IMCC34043]|nr:aa3-type cytochrome c oxidase subunit IV [Tropicimonas sp. IMCC34043]